jgi:hypothetical protein
MFKYQPKSLVLNALDFFWSDIDLSNEYLHEQVGGFEDKNYKGLFSMYRMEAKANSAALEQLRDDLPTGGYIYGLIKETEDLIREISEVWMKSFSKWTKPQVKSDKLVNLFEECDKRMLFENGYDLFDDLGEWFTAVRNKCIDLQADLEMHRTSDDSGEISSAIDDVTKDIKKMKELIRKALDPKGKILTNHFHILVGATRCSDDTMSPLFDLFQVVDKHSTDCSKKQTASAKEFSILFNPAFMAAVYKLGYCIVTRRISHFDKGECIASMLESRSGVAPFDAFMKIATADHRRVTNFSKKTNF